MPATSQRAPLPLALDLGGLYEQMLQRLAPISPRTHEALRDLMNRAEQVMAMRREVAKATTRLAKEKQFNRRVEANAALRELKTELKKLSG